MKPNQSTGLVSRLLGLVLILATVSITVLVTLPEQTGLLAPEATLHRHEEGLYFIAGELMAKKMNTRAAIRWSRCNLDNQSSCRPLADGFWLARGWVQLEEGENNFLPWIACFNPDNGQRIFVAVGRTQEANFYQVVALHDKARRQAETQQTGR